MSRSVPPSPGHRRPAPPRSGSVRPATAAGNRGRAVSPKLNPEQLLDKVKELEKYRQEEEKDRKRQEQQRRKEFQSAKKYLAKEIQDASRMKKKSEMEVGKVERSLSRVAQLGNQAKDKKAREVRTIDSEADKMQARRQELEMAREDKMAEMGEARSRLKNAELANRMLELGVLMNPAMMDDPERLALAPDGTASMMARKLPLQDEDLRSANSRLARENEELRAQLDRVQLGMGNTYAVVQHPQPPGSPQAVVHSARPMSPHRSALLDAGPQHQSQVLSVPGSAEKALSGSFVPPINGVVYTTTTSPQLTSSVRAIATPATGTAVQACGGGTPSSSGGRSHTLPVSGGLSSSYARLVSAPSPSPGVAGYPAAATGWPGQLINAGNGGSATASVAASPGAGSPLMATRVNSGFPAPVQPAVRIQSVVHPEVVAAQHKAMQGVTHHQVGVATASLSHRSNGFGAPYSGQMGVPMMQPRPMPVAAMPMHRGMEPVAAMPQEPVVMAPREWYKASAR